MAFATYAPSLPYYSVRSVRFSGLDLGAVWIVIYPVRRSHCSALDMQTMGRAQAILFAPGGLRLIQG